MRLRCAVLASVLLLPAAAAFVACERSADLRDDTQGGIDIGPTLDAGDIPDLDAGLGGDAHTACAERDLTAGCVGPVDFPCSFDIWAQQIIDGCQEASGCTTNGWVEVTMGDEGCVTSVGMTEPSPAMIDCLVALVEEARCPCGDGLTQEYLGEGNETCEDR